MAVLFVDEPRHRWDERPVSRESRRRDADARERGPLHRRVLRGAVARRAARRIHRAREQFRTVVAQGPFAPGRVRALAPRHHLASHRASIRTPHRPRRQADVADVERRRPEPLLHVRSERRAEHLDDADGRCGQAGHALHRRPRALADDFLRWPHDRVRARLRGVEARYRQRSGQQGLDHEARPAAGTGDRTPDTEQPVPGSLALARWPEGRVRGPRRDLGGLGTGRRGRRPRHAQLRARVADRMDARQPPHRVRLGARHRRARVSVRLHHVARNATDQRRDRRRGAARLARRQVCRLRSRRQGSAGAGS